MKKVIALEQWKAINGYEGLYEISSQGRVKSLRSKGKILIPGCNSVGYFRVDLCKPGHKIKKAFIHHLVAEAFIGSRPEGLIVDHDDGVKTNNRVGNLKYCTQQANIAHAIAMGLVDLTKNQGEKQGASKLTEKDVLRIYDLLDAGRTSQSVANLFGVSRTNIGLISRGKRWNHLYVQHNRDQ